MVKKMSFPAICTVLSYMRLSYSGFRAQLKAAYDKDDLTVRARALIDNLYSLFEYFIPVVCQFDLFMINICDILVCLCITEICI